MSETFYFQNLSNLPNIGGIYAWSLEPANFNNILTIEKILNCYGNQELFIDLKTSLRYGISFNSEILANSSWGNACVASDLLHNLKQESLPVLKNFLNSHFTSFSRPIYVGIAKNFYNRIYQGHAKKLENFWDLESEVSKYLANNQNVKIQEIIDKRIAKHSFSLQARLKEIAPRDLKVTIFPIDNNLITQLNLIDNEDEEDEEKNEIHKKTRRDIEKILHVLSDPILGRR